MFSSWLISLVSAYIQVLILMGYNVETTPAPRLTAAPLVPTQNSKTNYSGSDIDYEVYAYYLPFLKEQNVSNEEADYSYYENDYLSYYSYDKSVDDGNNPNHLHEIDDEFIDRETDVTENNSRQDAIELISPFKTGDESLTTKSVVTTNELQNAPELKKPTTMPTVKNGPFLTDESYAIDDRLQDVTEPYSPENDGKFMYIGIHATESSLEDVTEPDNLSEATIDYLQDAVESGILNETKDYSGAKELDVWNICLILVEEGSSYSLLFPCSSFEMQPACIGLDHRIGACSEIEGTPRQICVKKENPPYVVACNDPFSEAFCFESSADDRIIPCQDDRKRACLFEKGHLDICSAVAHDKLPF